MRWKLEWGCTTFTLLGINFSVALENMVEMNFNIQIPKVKALLKQWSRRILTPIGRVTVIKTLVVPKLNHLFLSLPNPRKEITVELTKAFSNFLWGSKCSKIKKDTVTQPTEQGGLNMINLEAFISSLKCTWIRRLLTGGQSWINVFVANFGKDFHSNLVDYGDDYVLQLAKATNNQFWKDVFMEWQNTIKVTYFENSTKSEVPLAPVWYNSKITINHTSVFFDKWYEKGVKVVHDFLDENGNILQRTDFQQKFDIAFISVMQYNSISCAISYFLRTTGFDFQDMHIELPYLPCHIRCMFGNTKCTKTIYNLLNHNTIQPTGILKWKTKLPAIAESIVMRDVFKICFKTTTDSSVQWLQYRILHRILPTNSFLHKIKIATCDLCTFCNLETESIAHVFFHCSRILPLWESLSMYTYNATSERIVFNISNVIFGEKPSGDIAINFIVLNTKQFIFRCLKQSKLPTFHGLLIHLKFKYNVE